MRRFLTPWWKPADSSLMIADDDDAWRMTLHDVFEPRGFRVYLASNGREALSVIERQRIDCMLLDMHMPELSGLETLQLVRRRKLLLPCIMVTADSSVHLRQRALSLRAFRVLTKPVSRELVTVTVEEALQSSSAAS